MEDKNLNFLEVLRRSCTDSYLLLSSSRGAKQFLIRASNVSMSGRRGSSARAETIEEDPYYTEPDYTDPDYIEPDYIEDEGEYDEKTVRRKEEERPVSDGAYYDTSTGKRRVEEPGPSKDQMRREFLAKIIIGSLGTAQ